MKNLLSLAFGLALLAAPAQAAEPIRIGGIAPYNFKAFFAQPFDNGVMMAVEEINQKGGVLGRPLEVLKRDPKMNPGEAVRLAEELRARDKVNLVLMADSSSASLAVGEWAEKNKVPFVIAGSEADSLIWGKAHDYQIRTDWGGYGWVSGTITKAMEIYGDKMKGKKWAVVAPNFEFGRSLVAGAKKVATDKGLDPQWVVEQWPTYDKMDAGATVAALKRAEPDIIFCMLFDTDLVKFVRESEKRGLAKGRIVIAPAVALPEHLDMLGAELPKGWVSLGVPYEEIKTPSFVAFVKAYQDAYHTPMRTYALTGYNSIKAIAAAIEKAGSVEPEKIKAVLDNLAFATPTGEQTIRPLDHQATAPFWVGTTDVVDGKPKLTNWSEVNMSVHSPSDAWIREQQQAAKKAP